MRWICLVLLFLFGCSGASAGDAGGATSTSSVATGDPTTEEPDDSPTSGGAPTSTGSTAGWESSTWLASSDETSSGGGASSGPPPGTCGDAVVDDGEACDEGIHNDDSAFCTESCTLNVCGDGKLLVGWEICDEGSANSDSYGSICDLQCTPGAFCGDNILDVGFEECDLGVKNGSGEDPDGISCDIHCRKNALRIFVSSAAWSGDLDGLEGADARCAALALEAGLTEPWRFSAFLSGESVSVNQRFVDIISETLPYVLLTGQKIADSYLDLVTDGPDVPGISVTEQGEPLVSVFVMTNTVPGGMLAGANHCDGWSSSDPAFQALTGVNQPSDPADVAAWAASGVWTDYGPHTCDVALHLYCIEF